MAAQIDTHDARDGGVTCAWPTMEAIEETARQARRTINDARHAAEDFIDDTVLRVRKHPLRFVGVAATVGVIAGAGLGFGAAWLARRNKRS